MKRWNVVPFWTIASRQERSGYPQKQLLSVYRDWGVVRRADRVDNFNKASDDLGSYKLVEPGDLVLNKMKTWQGSLGVSEYEGIVSPAYFVCSLSIGVHGRFVHHLLRSQRYIGYYAAGSKGIRPNQWDLPYDVLRQIPVVLPPVDEQQRIADFLDDRVSRIDRIIAARQEQIVLSTRTLEASVYADCKGNPLKPLRRYTLAVQTGGTPGDHANEVGGAPWYSPASFSGDLRLGDPVRRIHADMGVRFTGESVLLVAIGATAGRVAWLDHEATGNQQLTSIHAKPTVLNGRFLLHQLNARRGELRRSAPAATLPILNNELVKAFPVWVPDARVQQRLALEWDKRLARHIAGRRSLSRSIDLLAEYKTSLITAAVTGEMDITTAGSNIPG